MNPGSISMHFCASLRACWNKSRAQYAAERLQRQTTSKLSCSRDSEYILMACEKLPAENARFPRAMTYSPLISAKDCDRQETVSPRDCRVQLVANITVFFVVKPEDCGRLGSACVLQTLPPPPLAVGRMSFNDGGERCESVTSNRPCNVTDYRYVKIRMQEVFCTWRCCSLKAASFESEPIYSSKFKLSRPLGDSSPEKLKEHF